MAAPEVAIEVDGETGVWRTDGLAMLYVPRHFFINNHRAVEAALGRDAYAAQLYQSGFRSAWQWCEHEARQHGLAGIEVFHHYMRRLSQRGWGRFDGGAIDAASGEGTVSVRHSCFVEQAKADGLAAQTLCYAFAGWMPGALAWVFQRDIADFDCREVRCAGSGAAHCAFQISSIADAASTAARSPDGG